MCSNVQTFACFDNSPKNIVQPHSCQEPPLKKLKPLEQEEAQEPEKADSTAAGQ